MKKDIKITKKYLTEDGKLNRVFPEFLDGDFDCGTFKITSLIGCPKEITGDFTVYGNPQLTSLEGCPQKIGGKFDGANIGITSLEGGPQYIGGSFTCYNSSSIKSLKGLPLHIPGDLLINGTSIRTLEGMSETVDGEVRMHSTPLYTLEGIGRKYLKSCLILRLPYPPIKENVLGLLLIKNLKAIQMNNSNFQTVSTPWLDIIQKHLASERDVLECQEELIDKGFKNYAKL